ncbi:MAG: 16S rRNA (cytidine(1402)-2'-O)-methyltransferase [Nannocystaceae bacterium]
MGEPSTGTLVLVGTPIGNRGDLSPRARAAILAADLLLCEDTRSPTRLLGDSEPLPRRVSCFVGNEHERVAMLLERLAAGERVAFVSEAGMPVWSDPGAMLVRAAADAGFAVEVIPGPSAGTMGLALSGFSASWSQFVGFVDRSGGGRAASLRRVVEATGPSILFEAGNRVAGLLRDLSRAAPDAATRQVMVGRELTKLHEEVYRGSLEELAEVLAGGVRGEVTVVIDGAPSSLREAAEIDQRAGAREVLGLMTDLSLKPKARAKAIASRTGLSIRDVYARLSAQRSPSPLELEERHDEDQDVDD